MILENKIMLIQLLKEFKMAILLKEEKKCIKDNCLELWNAAQEFHKLISNEFGPLEEICSIDMHIMKTPARGDFEKEKSVLIKYIESTINNINNK